MAFQFPENYARLEYIINEGFHAIPFLSQVINLILNYVHMFTKA